MSRYPPDPGRIRSSVEGGPRDAGSNCEARQDELASGNRYGVEVVGLRET